ncbi:MAG: protein kinase, partial [Planctomycetota bacterium]
MSDTDESSGQVLDTCPVCAASLDVAGHGPFEAISCPVCSKRIRVRRNFDHFTILRKLGEGGMSLVFEAQDSKLDRLVALKILHPEFGGRGELSLQFEREAQLTAAISHPNVVKVYSFGMSQEYFYIAMELVEGASLEAIIDDQGKLPEKRVLEIAVQVSQGLRAANNEGL